MSISQLKYKSIFSWLSDIKDSIVLMDNPTEFFHPDDQYNLCTELKAHTRESNNQFLLGTHSHELCTALTPAHVKVID